MSVFAQSIKNVFAGSMESFKKFPSTIAFALIFTLITIVRIQLDWPQQEGNNFLFNCAHWSLAFGLVFSLMVITGAQSRLNTRRAFIIANILSIIALIVSFLILFYLGGNRIGS